LFPGLRNDTLRLATSVPLQQKQLFDRHRRWKSVDATRGVVLCQVQGLETGEYTVIAGDVTATFTLDVDNVLPEEE
jgi:hypothetical protein